MPDAIQSLQLASRARSLKNTFKELFYQFWRHPLTRGLLRHLIPRAAREYYHAYRQGYFFYDKTQVVLYAEPSVLPGYALRQLPAFHLGQAYPQTSGSSKSRVSLITTVLNQAEGIQTWLESLCQQTRLPDELVIADQGSMDETRANLQAFIESSPFPIQLVDAAGKSHAEALNLAIQNAAFPLIACTETGCTPDTTWLENLLYPLESNPDVQLSAGFFQGRVGSDFQRLCAHILTPHVNYIYPSSFVPSWRSIAMRKEVWIRADGYPEWLGDAPGEMLFFCHARQNNGLWAVVPGAMARARMPEHLGDLYRSCYQEGMEAGITSIEAARYWRKTLKLVAAVTLVGFAFLVGLISPMLFGPLGWSVPSTLLILFLCLVSYIIFSLGRRYELMAWLSAIFLIVRLTAGLARLKGFAAGVCKRPAAQARQVEHYQSQLKSILEQHPQRKGIIIYPPTHDWGYMFQLPQQMARQFARQGYLYFYGTINEKTDDVTGFCQVEPNLYLFHMPFETFQMLEPGPEHPPPPDSQKLILYIGSPWNQKYLAYFAEPVIIYDHYDDLAVSSGRLEDHQHMLQTADIVLVTSQRLLDNVKDVRPDTIFAPNGVDYEHFQDLRPAQGAVAPADLQPILAKGKPVIGYTGAFTERFDFDLYLHLVKARSDYEFVLIGADIDGSLDRSGLLKTGLDNMSWLGMKTHDELIKYLWRFHVGIVPFKINKITLATTSIKVFEYMACQVPVVSVAMPESRRYPGVFIAETYDQFVEHLGTALRSKMDNDYLAMIDRVARANTWGNRADKILGMIEKILRVKQAGVSNE